ncbi:PAS domain-containing protein [Devosia submarina]|uniref:PAS domain-containing protein n=1 Tax=Devosia submarina TaxID=1173082 RepID=UPI000D3921EE|nr:PAS domain-containing protein [Devosia submarina]
MPHHLFPAATPETLERLGEIPLLKLISNFDWSLTPLGAITGWSESLKGAVRVMMTSSTAMAMLIGEEGILVYNQAYADFVGTRHPEIFGMPAVQAWPEAAAFNHDKIERGLAGLSTSLPAAEMTLNLNGQPETFWLELHYSPVMGDDGLPLGSLAILHDITDRMMAEKALARSEERLSLALNGSTLVGTWDWDVSGDVVTADDKFAQMYNLDPLRAGLGVPVSDFVRAIHPDDAGRVNKEIEEALQTGGQLRSEYRLVGANGEISWVVASGRPRMGPDGRAERFPGVVFDVTEQRRIAEALQQSELQFRTLADTMPQMVWSTLPNGYHDYYNARWYEFTGVPVGSTDGEAWNDMFHPDDQERAREVWMHSLQTGEPYEIEYRLKHHSGVYRWTLGLAQPIRDSAGNIVRWFGTCTDIHQAKIAAEERELVAQELSHRIKNIFAVLNGIISLSARSRPEIKPYADELRQRIFALGEAHDYIRPRSHASAAAGGRGTLKELVERLMQPYRAANGDRMEIIGDDVVIDDAAATPLAMLFHELATNAAKYGSLSATEGRVVLTGSQSGDYYHLSWKEIGGPPLEGTAAKGSFGSRMIELSVQGQLSGKLERFWEPDGLRVEIDLPLQGLQRSARLQN